MLMDWRMKTRGRGFFLGRALSPDVCRRPLLGSLVLLILDSVRPVSGRCE